ncbi:MAG: hypothetical protein UY20_C0016G0003 [Candidatus Yanofskybacteria bacterium GW2011_GWA1_48_10]|uniref:Uncharacterized protein n=1 Tax=Candidatus Yanofskybacteria bacterium GW2011_GWA1_48_10 TaxID=1619022 RepID=A0A0G1U4W4_9BACT|nr:MAG: hypothetical protein UY20_C0016G0003 [Candidatus Yanofskybacteria bacterium GW2011_GWA1_48_10]
MERPRVRSEVKQENPTSPENRNRGRLLRAISLAGVLGALAFLQRDGNAVQATDNSVDTQTRHTLSLENSPNQPEYSRLVQASTRVRGYIEVPDGQQMEEADRQAFDNILKGVQQWFYDNIGATFEIGGDVQFITQPDIQYPANLPDFFEGHRDTPRIGAFVSSSGLGAACDQGINRTIFLIESLAGWRDQNINTPVPIPAHNLRFAGPCPGNGGLGAAYLGEDWLDTEPQDRVVIAIALDVAIANALGDANAPTLAEFEAYPVFTTAQAEQLRNSPLFTRINPAWQQQNPPEPAPPAGSTHLEPGVNFITSTTRGCQPPEVIFKSLIDNGEPLALWAFNNDIGDWEGYDPRFPEVSNLRQICFLQVVVVTVKSPADWQQPSVRTLEGGSRNYGNGIIGPSDADVARTRRPRQTAKAA